MWATTWLDWPLAALLVLGGLPFLWWRDRRAGLTRRQMLLRTAFAMWLAALVAVAFFPLPLPPYRGSEEMLADYRGWPYPWASPVPFETIRSSLAQGWSYPAGKFLVGNIGAFVPLGLFAPMLSARWRSWPRALLLGLVASGLAEGAQLGLSLVMGFPWRVADVDDVLLNTLGTLIGFGVWVAGTAALEWRLHASPRR